MQNGGYATAPTFNSDTFVGWTVDGKTVVNLSTYKITANTTFTAKFGTWTRLGDDMHYVYGDSTMKSVDIAVSGLKAGDKIKVTANYIKANIRDDGNNSFWYNSPDGNSCYGYEYGYDGQWQQLQYEGDGGNAGDKELTSLAPFSATLGLVDYGTENIFTITISCKRDGYLTIEWSDNAGFYIEMMTMWELYVMR